jgi:hypothetical protein
MLALAQSNAAAKPAGHHPSPVQASIDIRDTASPNDDYIAWAPAPATLRVTHTAGKPVLIYLTNEAPEADGKGHVNFAPSAGAYKTAIDGHQTNLDQIALTVPASGDVKFVVAGDFPHFSHDDKDVTIVAHLGRADGPVVGKQSLMVRVRRNLETLSPEEKNRFLWAMTTLRFKKSKTAERFYEFMVDIHDIGARGYPDLYPDQEHKGSAFLPWHRAFLLEFERELQTVDPSVTFPYWPIFRASSPTGSEVFQADFTGANSVTPNKDFAIAEPSDFAPGNPLYGWFIGGRGPLTRWTYDRSSPDFNTPGDLIDVNHTLPQKGFFTFATNSIEDNPHNFGHNWAGVWMSNCRISPSDPLFWPFHAYFDWLWAAWQQSYGRYARDGKDSKDFYPNDAFTAGSPVPIGHHLKDTMWPWNGVTTPPTGDFNHRRPDIAPGGKFPASGQAGVWPNAEAEPTPADLIDYAGYTAPDDDTNVGYDNIPWSPAQGLPPLPGGAATNTASVADLLDSSKPLAERIEAAAHAELAAATARVEDIRKLAADPAADPRLKVAALKLLVRVDSKSAVLAAMEIRKAATDPALRSAVAQALQLQMLAGVTVPKAAHPAAPPSDRKTDYDAARGYVPDNDTDEVMALSGFVAQFLAAPDKATGFPPQDAAGFIVSTNVLLPHPMMHTGMAMDVAAPFDPAAVKANLRKLLSLPASTPVASEVDLWKAKGFAALALAADPQARDGIKALALDPAAPVRVRAMALLALSHFDAETFLPTAMTVASDETLPPELRARAVATVGTFVTNTVGSLSPAQLKSIAGLLAKLKGDGKIKPAVDTSMKLVDLASTWGTK